jgi:hypothetical protein
VERVINRHTGLTNDIDHHETFYTLCFFHCHAREHFLSLGTPSEQSTIYRKCTQGLHTYPDSSGSSNQLDRIPRRPDTSIVQRTRKMFSSVSDCDGYWRYQCVQYYLWLYGEALKWKWCPCQGIWWWSEAEASIQWFDLASRDKALVILSSILVLYSYSLVMLIISFKTPTVWTLVRQRSYIQQVMSTSADASTRNPTIVLPHPTKCLLHVRSKKRQ